MPAPYIVLGQELKDRLQQAAKELQHSMNEAEITLWPKLRANRMHGFHLVVNKRSGITSLISTATLIVSLSRLMAKSSKPNLSMTSNATRRLKAWASV